MQRQESVGKTCVVLEERRRVSGPVACGAPQGAVGSEQHMPCEPGDATGRVEVVTPCQNAARLREGLEQQPVPGCQLLLVSRGPHPRPARIEQCRAGASNDIGLGRGADDSKDAATLPVTAWCDVPVVHHRVDLRRGQPRLAEERPELPIGPDVETPFLALAVGVQRRREPAVGGRQLPEHEIERRLDDGAVPLLTGRPIRLEVGVRQLGVVVEHLLEVRDEPVRIGAVTGEAATKLVVDSAVGHRVERHRHHTKRLGIPAAVPRQQEELERHGRRKFGSATEAAVHGIETSRQATDRSIQLVTLRVPAARRKGKLLLEVARQHSGLGRDLVTACAVGLRDAGKDPREARQSVAIGRREVGPAVERLQVRRQEHVHGPAARPGHGLYRGHVDLIEVRALLAIHLDRYEVAVHELGDRRILERLPLHDMAPVAG